MGYCSPEVSVTGVTLPNHQVLLKPTIDVRKPGTANAKRWRDAPDPHVERTSTVQLPFWTAHNHPKHVDDHDRSGAIKQPPWNLRKIAATTPSNYRGEG